MTRGPRTSTLSTVMSGEAFEDAMEWLRRQVAEDEGQARESADRLRGYVAAYATELEASFGRITNIESEP